MKSQITKPSPFLFYSGYVVLPGMHLQVENNKYFYVTDTAGGQHAIAGLNSLNQIRLGTTGHPANLDIYVNASQLITLNDGTIRFAFDELDNIRISNAIAGTGLSKGVHFPKGVNPTGDPANGFSINADATNGFPYVRDENGNKGRLSLIKTGTYTGDGTVSQAITGIGFLPQKVEILVTATGEIITTTSDLVPTALKTGTGGVGNAIISLDADGFTVDDGGANSHPNANATLYYYTVWG